jgi:hypothetical protein
LARERIERALKARRLAPCCFTVVFRYLSPVPTAKVLLQGSRRQGDGAMPIKHLLGNSKLGPEDTKKLDAAYSYALRSLGLVDRNDPLCEIIARKIIEVGAVADSNPRQIADRAVKKIGLE